jgi:hypothetical protein
VHMQLGERRALSGQRALNGRRAQALSVRMPLSGWCTHVGA